MRQQKRKTPPAEITRLRDRVEKWRKTCTKRSPMPEPLWNEAVRLARIHGVYATSREVGVYYEGLKKRSELAQEPDVPSGEGSAISSAFVELSATQLVGGNAPSAAVVELASGDGRRMTIRLEQTGGIDVAGLVATFLGRRR